jgi:hypothetical protein
VRIDDASSLILLEAARYTENTGGTIDRGNRAWIDRVSRQTPTVAGPIIKG